MTTIKEAVAFYKGNGNQIRPKRYFPPPMTFDDYKSGRYPVDPLPEGVTPVPMDDVLNDSNLDGIPLNVVDASRYGGLLFGDGVDAINAVIGTWDLMNMPEAEYKAFIGRLDARIAEGAKASAVGRGRLHGRRWARAPESFSLDGKLPLTYNLLTGLQTFGWLYDDDGEATQDAGSRSTLLPFLMEILQERYKVKVDDVKRRFTVVEKIATAEDVQGGGAVASGKRRGGKARAKKPMATAEGADGSIYARDMSIHRDATNWRRYFKAVLEYEWGECRSERDTFDTVGRMRRGVEHNVMLTHATWAVSGSPCFIPGNDYIIAQRKIMSAWMADYSPYSSALYDADAELARDKGGVPAPLVQALLDNLEKFITAMMEDRQKCVDGQYGDVVEIYDKGLPKWLEMRDGYRRMLEIADEDKCRVKPERLRDFDEPITGQFDRGFEDGLEKPLTRTFAWRQIDNHGFMRSHPEYRRGYRMAVTHSVCPFCGAVYEYDEAQDGLGMTCEACGKGVQVHRGMLIPWQSVEDSCTCVMSLDKEHILHSAKWINEWVRNDNPQPTDTSKLRKPKPVLHMWCKCGACRKAEWQDGRLIVGPWTI